MKKEPSAPVKTNEWNEWKTAKATFGIRFRPTVSIYSVSAKNFHFGASLDRTAIFILFTFCLFLLFKLSFIYFIRDQFLFFYCTCSNVSSLTLLPSVVFDVGSVSHSVCFAQSEPAPGSLWAGRPLPSGPVLCVVHALFPLHKVTLYYTHTR